MNEPKRLLEDAELDQGLKDLLLSIPAPTPPASEKMSALVEQLALAGASGAAAHGATIWLKLAFVGGAIVLAAGGYLLLRPSESAPEAWSAAPGVASSKPQQVAATPLLREEPRPAPEPVAAPRSSVRGRSTADSLAEEASLLERARRAKLSAPGEALALLEQHRQRYPRGELAAERLFLSVKVWERLGNTAMSEKQAAALIQRYPGSVYATQLKARRQR